jgi:DNA-binding GntR family transcriptional regulator
VRQVVHLPLQYTSWMWYTPQQLEVSGHYHRRVAHALEARDTQRAEGLMKAHVLESRDVLVARLEDLEQSVDGRRRRR